MRPFAILVLLAALIGSWSAPAGATAPAPATPPVKAEVADEPIMTPTLAMVAGGVIGVVLVSGAINVATAVGMVTAGAGLIEALNTGASLTVPSAILSAILGAIYGPEYLVRNRDGSESAP